MRKQAVKKISREEIEVTAVTILLIGYLVAEYIIFLIQNHK